MDEKKETIRIASAVKNGSLPGSQRRSADGANPSGKARMRRAKRENEISSILSHLRESGGGALAPAASDPKPAPRAVQKTPNSSQSHKTPSLVFDEKPRVRNEKTSQASVQRPVRKASGKSARERRRARLQAVKPEEPLMGGTLLRSIAQKAHLQEGARLAEKVVSAVPQPTSKEPRVAERKSRERSTKDAPSRRTTAPRRGRTSTTSRRVASLETERSEEAQPMASSRYVERRTPPVMTRHSLGGGFSMASTPRRSHAPRRTYYVALDAPGAELRLPALPRIQFGWRAFSGLMTALLLLAIFYIWQSPAFQVATMEVEGLQRLTISDLNTVTGVLGQSVFTINPVLLEDTLRVAFPEFSFVEVHVDLPASVKVTVTERQPVLAWVQEGRELWVDQEGVTFPPRGEVPAAVPAGNASSALGVGKVETEQPTQAFLRIQAHSAPPSAAFLPPSGISSYGWKGAAGAAVESSLRLPPELVRTIQAMSLHAPQGAQLVYDSGHGLGWIDEHGWEVYFGAETEDISAKLVVYDAIVARLGAEGIQPELISVEYIHAPYYRMER
ncbi:MAG: FtsQ-type POTRA domain-containing protein [Anaerolineales bacterium]|nr:FtsQ-type POTRA domain-containing protein [Anaerolineales bacterium]